MTIFEVSIGTKLEVEIANQYDSKPNQVFISQLLDIIDEKNIVIAAPIFESRLVFIPVGSKIRIVLFHGKYGLLSLPLAVSSISRNNNIVSYNAVIEGSFEKIQRREHYRLECFISTEYRLIPEHNIREWKNPGSTENELKKVVLKNISGSGACIVTDDEVSKDSHLELHIRINNELTIKALCRVLRTAKIETAKTLKYELGVHFDKINPKDQDLIIKYIFDQQRLLLKNNSIG